VSLRLAVIWIVALGVSTLTAAPLRAAGTDPAGTLRATPAEIRDAGEDPVPILLTGLRGKPHVVVDRLYLEASPPVANGSSAAFAVTKIAGGRTDVTVSDDAGQRISIPVDAMKPPCTIPVPPISLAREDVAYESDGASTHRRLTYLLFTSQMFARLGDDLALPVRLLGSDNSLLRARSLRPVSALTERLAEPPMFAPSAGLVYFAAFPALPYGVTYRVQLVVTCEAPIVLGEFTTRSRDAARAAPPQSQSQPAGVSGPYVTPPMSVISPPP
jgi:hypothetical protein